MKSTRTRLAAAVGVAATAAMTAAVLGASPAQAGEVVLGADASNAIDGEYIVAMKDSMSTKAAKGLLSDYDGVVTDAFSSLDSFAVEMDAGDARSLAADPDVDYVEQNGTVSIAATQASPPSWGLDRLDQNALPLDNSYTYPDSAGAGVTAYIIDTGADLDHPDYGGRMSSGTDTVDNDSDASDCQGHGSHVAGTIGGKSYGVAKSVKMKAVRVLDCNGSGSYDGVIAGINWVTNNHSGPSVANMSLGGGFSQAINDAVTASIASGVTYGVAAGNDSGANACNTSPASTPNAITVGATEKTDARASFSNIGNCVDIFAPGVNITSAWLNGGTNTISGTSMATPHVVGVAALYLGENPTAAPSAVASALVNNALSGVVGNPGTGSPNKLLNIGFLNGGGGDPDPEPGDCVKANTTATAIPDRSTVNSTVSMACDRSAATGATVAVDITHTYRGDIAISLIAPDGTSYSLKTANILDGADNVKETYTVNLSSEAAGGTWTLRVTDSYSGDTGTLNGWTLTV